MTPGGAKVAWQGRVLAIQPRIRLIRSFDERTHSYLGYAVHLRGTLAGEAREFRVALGPAAHAKHGIRIGEEVAGAGHAVSDGRLEAADLHKVSGLRVVTRGSDAVAPSPPHHGVPPALAVYRARGHRRLAAATYAGSCATCLWGCEMTVELVIDQWSPDKRQYRRETFCYGPKSCALYVAGPTRKVPGRRGMSWEEEDWVDEDATAHRGPDE